MYIYIQKPRLVVICSQLRSSSTCPCRTITPQRLQQDSKDFLPEAAPNIGFTFIPQTTSNNPNLVEVLIQPQGPAVAECHTPGGGEMRGGENAGKAKGTSAEIAGSTRKRTGRDETDEGLHQNSRKGSDFIPNRRINRLVHNIFSVVFSPMTA